MILLYVAPWRSNWIVSDVAVTLRLEVGRQILADRLYELLTKMRFPASA